MSELLGICWICKKSHALDPKRFPQIAQFSNPNGHTCKVKWTLTATQMAKVHSSPTFKEWCQENKWESDYWNAIPGILLTEPTLVCMILNEPLGQGKTE